MADGEKIIRIPQKKKQMLQTIKSVSRISGPKEPILALWGFHPGYASLPCTEYAVLLLPVRLLVSFNLSFFALLLAG